MLTPPDASLSLLVAVALAQAAVFATSVYLHRALAHRSLAVHPIADVLFRAILWLTTGQRRREWVAVHRNSSAVSSGSGEGSSRPRCTGFSTSSFWHR